MYQALYRKWRPRTFDDVVGQEHITETLKNQVKTGRLSHAYLFVGTRGTGKTTCAKILAKAVNCEHTVNGNPCNECASCRGIDDGSILDVVELDAASNNGVDNVRALRDEAVFSPVSVKKRVYIIDEVHMLSTSAFNALLKILEEPPEHLLFILATTELQKVPATILSRCQRHSFKRIAPDALAGRIRYVAEQEGMKLEPDAADLLARLADGALRDGLSLLDQCSGYEDITAENVLSAMGLAGNLRIAELLEKVSDGDAETAISIFTGLWQDGKAPVSLLRELSALLRDILMCKVAPKGGSGLLSGNFSQETLKSFSKRMKEEELIADIDTVQAHIASLRDGRDPRTTAELCLVMLSRPELGDGLNVLKARVAKLENVVQDGTVQIAHNEINRFKKRADMADIEDRMQSGSRPEKNEPEIAGKDTFSPSPRGSKRDEPPFDLEGAPGSRQEAFVHRPEPERKEPPLDDEPPFDLDEPPEPKRETPARVMESGLSEEETRAFSDGETLPTEEKAPSPTSVSGGNDALWPKVVALLPKVLQRGQMVIVKNQTSGSFDGTTLTIGVATGFGKAQLEQSPVLEKIRAAVAEVAGQVVPVKIILSEGEQETNTGKLKADLSQFGNVKFE